VAQLLVEHGFLRLGRFRRARATSVPHADPALFSLENAAKKLCDMRAPRARQIMHYQYKGFDNPAVKPSRYGSAECSLPRFLGAASTVSKNVF
jgi:hypothetical protein